MRRSKQQTAETRQQIIEAASALFRERGVEGVSVAEIMEDAGLTHGGFYKHFESKEALLNEAAIAAFNESMCAWEETLAKPENANQSVTSLIDKYLSETHADDITHGCPVVALGSEIARRTSDLKHSFAAGIKGMIDVFEQQLNNEGIPESKNFAVVIVANLVGTMMLARCTDNDKTKSTYLKTSNDMLHRLLSSRAERGQKIADDNRP
jgi:TetR/AcrR family transcriptional regulator, transcriptional repressor for nem operon